MTEMKENFGDFYRLGYSFSNRKLYYLKSDKKGFDGLRFYDGKRIEDWPEGITIYFEGEPDEDFLPGGFHWILVSEKVRQVFMQNDIEGVQFLPVRAVLYRTGENLGQYWVLNVIQEVKNLEWNTVRNLDFFRQSTGLFLSGRFKEKLEQAHATSGAGFDRYKIK